MSYTRRFDQPGGTYISDLNAQNAEIVDLTVTGSFIPPAGPGAYPFPGPIGEILFANGVIDSTNKINVAGSPIQINDHIDFNSKNITEVGTITINNGNFTLRFLGSDAIQHGSLWLDATDNIHLNAWRGSGNAGIILSKNGVQKMFIDTDIFINDNEVFDNALSIYWKDTGSVARECLSLHADDNLYIGNNLPVGKSILLRNNGVSIASAASNGFSVAVGQLFMNGLSIQNPNAINMNNNAPLRWRNVADTTGLRMLLFNTTDNFRVGVDIAAGKNLTLETNNVARITINDTNITCSETMSMSNTKITSVAVGTVDSDAIARSQSTSTTLLFNSGGNLVANRYILYSMQTPTESNGQILFPYAGTISNLFVKITAAGGVGTSRIFTLNKNTVATSLVVTLNDPSTTGNNVVNTISVVSGDLISLVHTVVGVPASAVGIISFEFRKS